MLDTDPRLPRNPLSGYIAELVNRLCVLFPLFAERINKQAESLIISFPYTASSNDSIIAIAERPVNVKAVHGRVTTPATDPGAVTAVIRKIPDGTIITAGVAVHAGAYNLKGTVNTVQTMVMTDPAASVMLIEGDSVGIDFSGVLTGATGTLSVLLEPV